MLDLIIGLSLSILSALVSLKSKWKENKVQGKDNTNDILLFILLVLGLFLSFHTGCNSYYTSKATSDSLRIKDSSYQALLKTNNSKSDSLRDSIISAKNKIIYLGNQSKIESNRIRDSLNLAKTQIISFQKKSYTDLLNNTTGGTSNPLLEMYVSPAVNDIRYKKNYFIVIFSILDRGDFPLQNVKCSINDMFGFKMLELGIKHFGNGLSGGFDGRPEDVTDYETTKHIELGSITPNKEYRIYTTTISKQLTGDSTMGYSGEIQWNNGSLIYFVNLIIADNDVKLDTVQIVVNGKRIKDIKKFFTFNKQIRISNSKKD